MKSQIHSGSKRERVRERERIKQTERARGNALNLTGPAKNCFWVQPHKWRLFGFQACIAGMSLFPSNQLSRWYPKCLPWPSVCTVPIKLSTYTDRFWVKKRCLIAISRFTWVMYRLVDCGTVGPKTLVSFQSRHCDWHTPLPKPYNTGPGDCCLKWSMASHQDVLNRLWNPYTPCMEYLPTFTPPMAQM